ncbi:hypothetical protein IW150_005663, partial [Coemansia sp. RSA 2607]
NATDLQVEDDNNSINSDPAFTAHSDADPEPTVVGKDDNVDTQADMARTLDFAIDAGESSDLGSFSDYYNNDFEPDFTSNSDADSEPAVVGEDGNINAGTDIATTLDFEIYTGNSSDLGSFSNYFNNDSEPDVTPNSDFETDSNTSDNADAADIIDEDLNMIAVVNKAEWDALVADKIFSEPNTAIELADNPYDPLEPEVASEHNLTELILEPYANFQCNTGYLLGAYHGFFGSSNPHSVVAYGPRHLSACSSRHSDIPYDLTELLPECIFKKMVPLSDDIFGIIADVKESDGGYNKDQMLLFDIDAAIADMPRALLSTFFWPKVSPRTTGVATISNMRTVDDRTFFLSGRANSTEVYIHSFSQDNGAFTETTSEHISAHIGSQVTALCYDNQYGRVVVGSLDGQISVDDGTTGGHICSGYLDDSDTKYVRLNVTNLSVCPTSPHLVMASCGTRRGQIKIVDLRDPIRPVLECGMDLISEYHKEIVPAWDPHTGVIVAPFNQDQTKDGKNVLALYDTRFIGIRKEASFYGPLDAGTMSVHFNTLDNLIDGTMVTAGTDGI